LYGQCRAGAQINFPESGLGLGHVTPTIFGSMVGYPSEQLDLLYEHLWLLFLKPVMSDVTASESYLQESLMQVTFMLVGTCMSFIKPFGHR